MKKNVNKSLINILGCNIISFALMVTSSSVNRTCVFIAHQPKLPESAKKFRKF